MRVSGKASSRRSRQTSRGRKRTTKKSYTSVVLEEPSREDRGFAFNSRYSVPGTQSFQSSVHLRSSKKKHEFGSTINISILKNQSKGQASSLSPSHFQSDQRNELLCALSPDSVVEPD